MPKASKPEPPRTVADLVRENANLRRQLERLEVFRTLAYRDPLTGVWNRRYFEERLGEELSRATRVTGRSFTVMVVDVNDMKRINDVQGHAAGDRALAWVGEFLRVTLRTHDICCRIGGDEFAVIFPDQNRAGGAALVSRLRRALVTANQQRRMRIALSFGIGTYPEDGATAEDLFGVADAAMYSDKRRQKMDSGEHTPVPTPIPAFTYDS